MKLISKHKIYLWTTLLVLPLLVIACLEFESITQPETTQVNTEIEFSAKLKISAATDDTGKMVFAILAPKKWNLANNASLTVTTTNYNEVQGHPDVTDEPLSVMPASEIEPGFKKPWQEAYKEHKGIGGNDKLTDPVDVEWVVWRSTTTFMIKDKVNNVTLPPVFAEVKIKMTTGEEPIMCNLGYSYCCTGRGLKDNDRDYCDVVQFKPITVYPPLFSVIPSVFRYGDIFSLQFSQGGTDLEDATEVYLCGTATYNSGQTAEVTTAGKLNRMELTKSSFVKLAKKYIYPKQFFNLPADAVIEELRFYFTNADGSIIVKDGDKGFFVEQAAE